MLGAVSLAIGTTRIATSTILTLGIRQQGQAADGIGTNVRF